jgi:hypothetical protein
VTRIGSRAFKGCPLESLVLPKSVSLGRAAVRLRAESWAVYLRKQAAGFIWAWPNSQSIVTIFSVSATMNVSIQAMPWEKGIVLRPILRSEKVWSVEEEKHCAKIVGG